MAPGGNDQRGQYRGLVSCRWNLVENNRSLVSVIYLSQMVKSKPFPGVTA